MGHRLIIEWLYFRGPKELIKIRTKVDNTKIKLGRTKTKTSTKLAGMSIETANTKLVWTIVSKTSLTKENTNMVVVKLTTHIYGVETTINFIFKEGNYTIDIRSNYQMGS